MFTLPPALAALRTLPQFILYRLVPSATRPGKTDKFPINPTTAEPHNAHDPTIWMDVDSAAALAEAFGADHGVGFVFTPQDDFWFIDIDDCLQADGTWSPTALALLDRFRGAAWEVSVSGRGLHGIARGSAGPPPPARKVKFAHWFDLYTENRFVALTGTNAIGDAATDHTPALARLVSDYLTLDTGPQLGWTSAPDPRWRGNADDDRLLERMLRSGSSSQKFGGKAMFSQLWNADHDALAQFFPDPHRAFDASRADSALAQALAFWTGNDCERIQRFMLRSALRREKWDREDYLPRTILGAVARQYDVLTDREIERPHTVAGSMETPRAKLVTGETFMGIDNQAELFKGCIYVTDRHRALIPGGWLLKPDQFRVVYGGYSFPMDQQNERVVRNSWEAFTESQILKSPRVDSLCFRPELPPGAIVDEAGVTMANSWWPITTPSAPGDVTPFLRHMEKLLPDEGDRMKLLSFAAAITQYPGRKFQWAPLIQGVPGNGKTMLITAVARAVGDRYTHLPNAADMMGNGGKFTGWLQGKLFIGIEEIYTGDKRDMMEILKPLITNPRIEIQSKGVDQVTGDNRANVIASSNHMDALSINNEERRWAIFFTAQQRVEDLARDGMDGNYMPDLWDWFEGRGRYTTPGFHYITHWLRTFAIPDELNPSGAMHRAPITTSTNEAISLSLGAIEQEVLEAVGRADPGFAGGWISSMAVDKLLMRLNSEKRLPPRKRRAMLNALNYIWHPALAEFEGRVSSAVQPDGGRTRLYIRKGHILGNIETPKNVIAQYEKDQAEAIVKKANFGS